MRNKYDYNNDSSIEGLNETLIRIEIIRFIQEVNYWLMITGFFMVIFGVLGNGLALIVINRRSLRSTSSSVFITYLAIFDTLVLIVHQTGLITSRSINSHIVHCFITFFTDFVTFCSVWIMVIMTVERFIAVHSPLLAKGFCTLKRARYSIYLLMFIAFTLFSLTFPLLYKIDNKQRKCIFRSQYQTIIRIIKPIIFFFIPDIILLVNLFIIYELFVARRKRTQTLINPENAINQINIALFNRQQQQLTLMLTTVSLSFYIFTTPIIIDFILQRKPPDHRDIKRLKMRFLLSNLTVLWLQMSSATNFLFYYLAGSKFRETCFQMFDDIYICMQRNLDTNYQRPRHSSGAVTTSNFSMEMRHIHPDYRNLTQSTSIQQTTTYISNNSSKRASNGTVSSAHLNSRQLSKCALNIPEL
ncbi:unnamed protein product [Rotaria socialis]|uniref:G-protein coupled receptors family 1 profile domain-containing protein n=1 Tax=Rotaria socialis TaxID=392032 RepID=A0A820U3L9_9BILA|nr:unnamed protein product [Rotaria socialis]CAF4480537.1 unnamed protein product [Rotaria socialis]